MLALSGGWMSRRLLCSIGILASLATASGCGSGGGTSTSSQDKIDAARKQGVIEEKAREKKAAAERAQKKLALEVAKLKKQVNKRPKTTTTAAGGTSGGTSPPASSSSNCGGNLSVGPNTSCAFGVLVERAYFQSGGGSGLVDAFSPVTQRTYTMTCTAGAPTVCRGGNNASVFIR
jgi:hypothetical protein